MGSGILSGMLIAGYLAMINMITFVLYGIDKRKAVKNQWRIRESTLLLLAAAGWGGWSMAGNESVSS